SISACHERGTTARTWPTRTSTSGEGEAAEETTRTDSVSGPGWLATGARVHAAIVAANSNAAVRERTILPAESVGRSVSPRQSVEYPASHWAGSDKRRDTAAAVGVGCAG